MDLIRMDPLPKEDEFPDNLRQESFAVKPIEDSLPESSSIQVIFNRFGRGELKQSDFAVEMSWLDMQLFLEAFIQMKHPEALQLKRILDLASAIEGSGWKTKHRPTSEFFEQSDS